MNSYTTSLRRSHHVVASTLAVVLGCALTQTCLAQTAPDAVNHVPALRTGSPVVGGVANSLELPASMQPGAPVATGELKTSGASMNLGMKMHGHWVIDVKNPDGTLVEHRDFQNSLSASAQGILIGLLAGGFTPGDYMIAMGAQTGNAPCVAVFQFCGIAHNLTTSPATNYCSAYYCSGNLTYGFNYGTLFSGPYSFVMSGSITANQAGTIGTVYTIYNACANVPVGTNPTGPLAITPAACVTNTVNNWVGPLSAAAITPVTVANGQIIQVTVTITFS